MISEGGGGLNAYKPLEKKLSVIIRVEKFLAGFRFLNVGCFKDSLTEA